MSPNDKFALLSVLILAVGVAVGWLVVPHRGPCYPEGLDEGYDEGWDDAMREAAVQDRAGRQDSAGADEGLARLAQAAGTAGLPVSRLQGMASYESPLDVPRPESPSAAGPGHTYPRLELAVLWADLAESMERAAVVEQWLVTA